MSETESGITKHSALIIGADFPDPDVIRVGDTYYMISTTMHFMPGGVILRSFDLVHWEIYSRVYERLDGNPAQRLEGDQGIYGQGMWAASLRFHAGWFYVCFCANDTHKTYLFRTQDLKGPWQKQNIEGFYHDSSLLFEDGAAYLVHGNTTIYLTELNEGLTGPKPGGLQRVIAEDRSERCLGYEGSHLYKIGNRYYLFLIHWLSTGNRRRVEACLSSDSLTGEFTGGDILDDDLGYHNMGVAQGGIVDTPEGDWYAVLFQDRGAVGRIPVLVPLRWEDNFPVLGVDGRVPISIEVKSTRPGHEYQPITDSDEFPYSLNEKGQPRLKDVWEWNHEPHAEGWSIAPGGGLLLKSSRLSENPTRALNVLTQRALFPSCAASVSVDGSLLKDGDFAGICALQGHYGMAALAREEDSFFIVMRAKRGEVNNAMGKTLDKEPGTESERIPWPNASAELRLELRFMDIEDEAIFYYRQAGQWKRLGAPQKLYFGLDHFVGCRFGLFLYSTKQIGGAARFNKFVYSGR
jgi:beta-xylosidase